jgi:protein TonB
LRRCLGSGRLRQNGEEAALLDQDLPERPPIDLSALDELPPHRAAVPVPPIILTDALSPRRRHPPWPSIVIAVALHAGFLAAALHWGQGEALPPVEDAIAVELVERIGPVGHPPVALTQPSAEHQRAAPPQSALVMTAAELKTDLAPGNPPAVGAPETESAALADTDAQGDRQQPEVARLSRRPLEASLERLRTMRDGKLASLEVRPGEERHALSPVSPPPPLPSQKELPEPSVATAAAPMRPDDAYLPPSRPSAAPIVMTMYKRRVRQRILQNLPLGMFGPGRVAIKLRLSPSGRVANAAVLRSSGSSAMDRAALMSVYAAGPYPVPPRGAVPSQLAFAINFRFQ